MLDRKTLVLCWAIDMIAEFQILRPGIAIAVLGHFLWGGMMLCKQEEWK